MSPEVSATWLGRVPYLQALEAQRARREAILAGTADEVLWLLEHPPVITTGRRHVDAITTDLDVVATERGGLATYHGPGQLVGYLLLDVAGRGGTVRGTVAGLERGVIAWLASRGVTARCQKGRPGVWVGDDKICALGLHFRKGVSMHGFALNLTVDLAGFEGFVPCGIDDAGVTSLHRLQPGAPAPEACWADVAKHVLAAVSHPG